MSVKSCIVCGAEFAPEKEKVYTVYEPQGFCVVIAGEKRFDVMDCPVCSCQNVLASRLPLFVEDNQSEGRAWK